MGNLPTIAGVEIPLDTESRYNLNALHRAYEAEMGEAQANKAPAQWLRNQQVQDFVSEVEKETMQICTVSVEGRNGGTFAHELIAIEYAGWLSPAFRIRVNQTFIDFRMGKLIRKPPTDPRTAAMIDALYRLDEVEQQQKAMASQIENNTRALEQIQTSIDYFTVIGWHRLHAKADLSLATASAMGKQATAYCRQHGIDTGTTPDPRYGTVNTYPEWVLDKLFTD